MYQYTKEGRIKTGGVESMEAWKKAPSSKKKRAGQRGESGMAYTKDTCTKEQTTQRQTPRDREIRNNTVDTTNQHIHIQ